ncbi:hypothetical protein WN55_08766 [Dufourea novaeangliae]|uniref:Uncharacterized protein n=1 Tax=Dufourea novaeangliae TaxID=178035 RepID=A0A154NZR1_DUFNO|nr:hypothetical protein WN55_08766 [Dufourea novaeangliae]
MGNPIFEHRLIVPKLRVLNISRSQTVSEIRKSWLLYGHQQGRSWVVGRPGGKTVSPPLLI